MRGALAGALIVACGFAGPARAQDLLAPDPPRDAIQPGMLVHTPTGSSCTGGFVYDGTGTLAGRHYLGLAAHCVDDRIGGRVSDAAGREFGTVALSVFPYADYSEDYAFGARVQRAARAVVAARRALVRRRSSATRRRLRGAQRDLRAAGKAVRRCG